jgi:hypothetical protein
VRCGRCGNENDKANRFCGMCGASLVTTTPAEARSAGQTATAPPVTVAAPRTAQAPLPEPAGLGTVNVERPLAPPASPQMRTSELRTREVPTSAVSSGAVRAGAVRPSEAKPSAGPVITGHSFLGLSTPGPAIDRYAESDTLRPSSNVDYLLDDEEEPKRGWGKMVLILVALGLAVGFGYLHFKQAGFDGLIADDKKPVAAKPTPEVAQSPDSGAATGPASSDSSSPAAGVSDNGTAPATVSGAAPPGAQAPAPSAPSQTAPPLSQAVPAASAPPQAVPPQASTSHAQSGDPNLPSGAAPASASGPDTQAAPAEALPTPKAAVSAPAMAKPPAAKPIDPVTNAERYIYGRGVRQDCDHGLQQLKQAADESNAKAMISMGALYSTGMCTPRDLPTAYRWFALALHKEPDNQALQDDLQKLWSQMTQPERQLAIKLSQ